MKHLKMITALLMVLALLTGITYPAETNVEAPLSSESYTLR